MMRHSLFLFAVILLVQLGLSSVTAQVTVCSHGILSFSVSILLCLSSAKEALTDGPVIFQECVLDCTECCKANPQATDCLHGSPNLCINDCSEYLRKALEFISNAYVLRGYINLDLKERAEHWKFWNAEFDLEHRSFVFLDAISSYTFEIGCMVMPRLKSYQTKICWVVVAVR